MQFDAILCDTNSIPARAPMCVCVFVTILLALNERNARHKLDLAIEEKIFVSNDLEDLRAETLRTEQNLRSDIEVRPSINPIG